MTEQPENEKRDNRVREPWRRHSSEKLLGGVCGGLARSYDIDPNVVRVAVAVVTLITGGWPILVYLALWLYLPDESGKSAGLKNRADTPWVVANIVGFVIGIPILLGIVGLLFLLSAGTMTGMGAGMMSTGMLDGNTSTTRLLVFLAIAGLFLLVPLLFGMKYLLDREKSAQQEVPPTANHQGPAPSRTARPAKSRLGRVTLSGAVFAVGAAWLWGNVAAIELRPIDYLTLVVVVLGIGLMVGAWWGRARWLAWFAVPLALYAVAYVNVPSGFTLDGGVGDKIGRAHV